MRKLAQPGQVGLEGAAGVVLRASEVAGSHLVGVAVFGSWARGEATEQSDVDILVVTDVERAITREQYRQWDEAPVRWESRRVEPLFVHLPASGERMTGLWAEVAVDGIVLFERGFALSRRLGELRSRIASGQMIRRWSNGYPYWVAA